MSLVSAKHSLSPSLSRPDRWTDMRADYISFFRSHSLVHIAYEIRNLGHLGGPSDPHKVPNGARDHLDNTTCHFR